MPCSCPVIPSQSADWRGNPSPAPAGAASPRPLCEAAQCSHWVVRRSVAEVTKPKVLTEGEICHGSAVAYGAMHPKGTCFASLHCVGIAPYGRATRVRWVSVSPSGTASLRYAQPSVHPKGTCFAASTGPPLHKGDVCHGAAVAYLSLRQNLRFCHLSYASPHNPV